MDGWVEQVLEGMERETRQTMLPVLHALEAAIAEGEATLDALLGPGGLVAEGRWPINVLEGGVPGPCRPVLLAEASQRRRPKRYLHGVLRHVRHHLLRCEQVTRAVILVTDYWSPDEFTDSLPDLALHAERRGVRVVPMLVSHRAVSWPRLELPGH